MWLGPQVEEWAGKRAWPSSGNQGLGHRCSGRNKDKFVLSLTSFFTELGPPKTPVKWWIEKKKMSPTHREDEVLLAWVLHEDKKSPLKIHKNRPALTGL